jgi:hypothetical protein
MSINATLLTAQTMTEHRATWYVWAGGQKMRRTGNERGPGWGYDVTCSCGAWASHTGGATRGSVERDLFDHRWSAQCDAEVRDAFPCRGCGAAAGAWCTDGPGRPSRGTLLHLERYEDNIAARKDQD